MNFWNTASPEWYDSIFKKEIHIHNEFFKWTQDKEIKSALEIGCGLGDHSLLFEDYTGIDLSPQAIENAKKRFKQNFECIDFMQFHQDKKYDLVFSHSVIDHVTELEFFIERCVELSNKYVYISSYQNFYPNLAENRLVHDENTNCYYVEFSDQAMYKILAKYNYLIKRLERGFVILIEL